MTRLMTCSLALVALSLATLATKAEAPKLETGAWLNLWEGKAPGALGDSAEDTRPFKSSCRRRKKPPARHRRLSGRRVRRPGGPRGGRGRGVARQNGVTASSRYRVGPKGYHHPIEMTDASRAIRFVRAHAAEWNLDPKRIGILGFSAGGHLASTIATHWDDGQADAADPIDKAAAGPTCRS